MHPANVNLSRTSRRKRSIVVDKDEEGGRGSWTQNLRPKPRRELRLVGSLIWEGERRS